MLALPRPGTARLIEFLGAGLFLKHGAAAYKNRDPPRAGKFDKKSACA